MLLKQKNIFSVFSTGLIFIMASYPWISSGFFVPSVSLCVEKTGLTEAECEEKLKNFGQLSTQQKLEMKNEVLGGKAADKNSATGTRQDNSSNKTTNNSVTIQERSEKAQEIRNKRKEQFAQVAGKAEKIRDFLRSKRVDVAEIEKNIETFKEKYAQVLGAYDAYAELSEADLTGNAAPSALKIRKALDDLIVFYRTTLRESMHRQLINISNE